MITNQQVTLLDARLNPGYTDKIQSQLALMMVKNIEKVIKSGK